MIHDIPPLPAKIYQHENHKKNRKNGQNAFHPRTFLRHRLTTAETDDRPTDTFTKQPQRSANKA